MSSLVELQARFTRAIRAPGATAPDGITTRPGTDLQQRFNIYRNNHVVGLVQALESTFPVTRQLVGSAFFGAAAMDYVRDHPPASPVLLLYGETFGDFLASLPGIQRYPYVADVARLEWARIFALNAADAAPVPVALLSGVAEDALGDATLSLHPSLRLLDSRWPVLSIWRDCREPGESGPVTLDRRERLVMVRPDSEVVTWLTGAAEFDFVRHLANGGTLAAAANAALAIDDRFDLAAELAALFQRGLVTGLTSSMPAASGQS